MLIIFAFHLNQEGNAKQKKKKKVFSSAYRIEVMIIRDPGN